MNKQELIKRIEGLKNIFGNKCEYVKIDFVIELASELDELEAGRANEAPRYVKNILARLRELPLHDREVWLKTIMGEFEQDFSRAKWREGYEQGKVEGLIEREKVVVPKFVADWIRKCKTFKHFAVSLSFALQPIVWEKNNLSDKCIDWLMDANNQEIFARAWLDGYEVEKEPKYTVKFKVTKQYLSNDELGPHFDPSFRSNFTKSDLEKLGLAEVFNSPLFEVEEVE